jgi:cation diffusion facilitator family transporter
MFILFFSDRKANAALLSILSNTMLVILKLLVGISTGAVSIISEAAHSGLDLVASIVAFFAVRKAVQPPDKQHAYGHGKFENLSGSIEAILIIVAAALIVREAGEKLFFPSPIDKLGIGAAVMLVSATVNYFVSRYLQKVGQETDSMALQADALHLQTDVYTSLGVLAGLGLIMLTGLPILDPLVAIGVAIFICKTGFELVIKSVAELTDIRLPDEEEAQIKEILDANVPRVVEYHKLRTRKAGSERHIDLHLVVSQSMTVGEAHRICDEVEYAIESHLDNSHVVIHLEPCTEAFGPCPYQSCQRKGDIRCR